MSMALGLFAALAMNPEVQLIAFAEINRVVGQDRLPQLGDLDQLPYIRAILKELTRWHVVAPFCMSIAFICPLQLLKAMVLAS
jgi:cytochrome P450